MLKVALTAAVLCTGLSSSAFAKDFFKKIIYSKFENYDVHKGSISELPLNLTYTNFSGSWVGSCDAGEEMGIHDPVSMQIENTLNYINIDGEEYGIDALNSSVGNNRFYSSFNHIYFKWNPEQTRLIAEISGNYVYYPDTGASQERNLKSYSAEVTFSMNGDKLEMDTAFEDKFTDITHNHCVFQRAR